MYKNIDSSSIQVQIVGTLSRRRRGGGAEEVKGQRQRSRSKFMINGQGHADQSSELLAVLIEGRWLSGRRCKITSG